GGAGRFDDALATAEGVLHETNRGGKSGRPDEIGEPGIPMWATESCRYAETVLGDFRQAAELGGSAGENDAGGDAVQVADALEFERDHFENFLGAGLEDFADVAERHLLGGLG